MHCNLKAGRLGFNFEAYNAPVNLPVKDQTSGHQLSVRRVRRSTLGTSALSVAGPTIWNSLPDHLRDPAVDSEQFRQELKTYLFAGHSSR